MRCRIVQSLCRGWRTDVYVPGNLLIQPNFAWHDHTNNSNEPIIRIDALDSGLVNYLLTASFREVPLGIHANARMLDVLMQASFKEGVTKKLARVDEIFHPRL